MPKIEEVLVPRIDKSRWPVPTGSVTLEKCGSVGRLVSNTYAGQKFPWGLYEQTGHAGSLLIVVDTPAGQHVAMVHQWRPADVDCVELPAGNIGHQPRQMLAGLLEEISQEVGEVVILQVHSCKGFAHDAGREVSAGGGGKCFFPFFIKARGLLTPKVHEDELGGDEKIRCRWYSPDQIRKMVQSGRIGDMVTCFFLLMAGIITSEDFQLQDITAEFLDLSQR